MAADLEDGTMAPGWWERGLDDLSAAETLAKQNFSGPWVIAYHAQQAAEKFIQAYLVAHGVSSDTAGFRTHEIDDLRGLVAEWDDELARRLSVADELSEYAVEVRYPPPAPDVDAEATAEEARAALKSAREVKRVLRAELEPILP